MVYAWAVKAFLCPYIGSVYVPYQILGPFGSVFGACFVESWVRGLKYGWQGSHKGPGSARTLSLLQQPAIAWIQVPVSIC